MTTNTIEKIDRAYSSEPWWYDVRGFLILTFAYRSTLPAQVRFFSKNIGAYHLEAAIGTGTLFGIILRWRKWTRLPESKITGFDYAERMLNGAKKRFANNQSLTLLQADAANLKFENDTFDTVNIANAVHCLPEPKAALHEIFRVLKPGGTLAGNCLLYPRGSGLLSRLALWIDQWGIKKGLLHKPYSKDEITSLLCESKFEVSYSKVTGNCLDFVVRKPIIEEARRSA
jgi:ubiquinone/menaquinone biosynthesis C-methylase UbiE